MDHVHHVPVITNKDAINIIRVFFNTLADILGLTTIVILGINMDSNQLSGDPIGGRWDSGQTHFEVDSTLSGFGVATFVVFAISDIFFGIHTAMSLQRESVLFRLNVVWTILSCILFFGAVTAWQGMCDKINSSLTHSECITSYCQHSFGSLMTTYAVALMFSHIPNILMFFGVL